MARWVEVQQWIRRQQVPPSATLVLFALAGRANRNCVCYPSQRQIAEDTRLTERSVRTQLATLEEVGLIERKQQRRKDGTRAADLYHLRLDRTVAKLPERVSASRNKRKQKPTQPDGRSGQEVTIEAGHPSVSPFPSVTTKPAPRRRAGSPHSGNGTDLTDGQLMQLVRQRFYAPDGQPPPRYDDGREFSIFGELRELGYSGEAIAQHIEGVARIRDDDGHVGDEHLEWLHRGDKLTMRALYNTSSGVRPVWSLAEQKLAEGFKRNGGNSRDGPQKLGAILAAAQRAGR